MNLYSFTVEEIERSQEMAMDVFERHVLAPAGRMGALRVELEHLRQLDAVIARVDAGVADDYEKLSDDERDGELGTVMLCYRRSRAAMRGRIKQHIARLEAQLS